MADERPGLVIAGRYRLDKPLGAGGMGSVWSAVQEPLGRPVAVKVLHPALTAEASMVARFKREAELAASIHHPNIAQVTDFGFEDGRAYLVMDLLEGSSLAAMLAEEGGLSEARTRRLALQILDALEAAHARDVVHRDLKPENIFVVRVSGMELVKILDFGIASLAGPSGEPTMTATGQVLGTPAYMSPEQARGKRVDARSDVFAVGAILYEILTGQRAFTGENYHELMFAVVEQEPPSITELRPDVSPALAAIVARALAKNAEQRWPSAEAMHDAISALEGLGEAIPMRAVSTGSSPLKVRSDAAFAPTVTPENPPAEPTHEPVIVSSAPPTGALENAPLRVRAKQAARYWWLGVGTLFGLAGVLLAFVQLGRAPEDDAAVGGDDVLLGAQVPETHDAMHPLAPAPDAGGTLDAGSAEEPPDARDPLADEPLAHDRAPEAPTPRPRHAAPLTARCGRAGYETPLVRVGPGARLPASYFNASEGGHARGPAVLATFNRLAAPAVAACYRGHGVYPGQQWHLEVDGEGAVERAHPNPYCPIDAAVVSCVNRALVGLRFDNALATPVRYTVGFGPEG